MDIVRYICRCPVSKMSSSHDPPRTNPTLGLTLEPAPSCGGAGAPLCLDSLQAYILELETDVSELRQQHERLLRERAKAVAQKSSCDAEVARLHATIQELKAENAVLTRQLRHSSESATMAQLRADNVQLQKDYTVLSNYVQQVESAMDALKATHRDELAAAHTHRRAWEDYDRKVADMNGPGRTMSGKLRR